MRSILAARVGDDAVGFFCLLTIRLSFIYFCFFIFFYEFSALESKGTVYFEDDFEDAKRVTEETLDAFERLCSASDEGTKQSLLEANRPKMKQLEQEFKNLQDELIHDE